MAQKPATPEKSYGYYRLEILAALVNLIGIAMLHRDADQNLKMQEALYEVIKDALGSVGVIIAGLVILTTGWPYSAHVVVNDGIDQRQEQKILTQINERLRQNVDIDHTTIQIEYSDLQAKERNYRTRHIYARI